MQMRLIEGALKVWQTRLATHKTRYCLRMVRMSTVPCLRDKDKTSILVLHNATVP